ncbi:MAG: hypothetical protein JSW50_11770, partial [Candidatus Latescibacterota bacterium]
MHRASAIAILSIVAGLAAVMVPVTASAGVEMIEERNGRIVVDVRFDGQPVSTTSVLNTPGLPPLRYERFYVALPASGSFRVARTGGTPTSRRGELPAVLPSSDPPGSFDRPVVVSMEPGIFPKTPHVVSTPIAFRNLRVIAIDCFASQVDYEAGVETLWNGYTIEIRYPPAETTVDAAVADPVLASLIINKAVVPAPAPRRGIGSPTPVRRAGPSGADIPDPHFSLSPNWVKIRLRTNGIYAITGSDLAQIGIDPATIEDPASFRMFTGGGREQIRKNDQGLPYQDVDGTWRPGQWMTECDIVVEYGGDGTFDPSDRILFYAVGCQGWLDWYEPGAPRELYHNHAYTKDNVYYLTWDDTPGFAGSPARMASRDAAPGAAGSDMDMFEERIYFEENRVEALSFGGDGWLWLDVTAKNYPETYTLNGFAAPGLVSSGRQTFRTIALAPFQRYKNNTNHHAVYIINDDDVAEVVFDVLNSAGYENGVPVEATGTFLKEASNTFRLHVPRDLNTEDFMYFDFYEVFYHRKLRATSNRLFFCSPDTTESVNYSVTNFAQNRTVYLFDTSDLYRPERLTGIIETDNGPSRDIRFSSTPGAHRQYFWVGSSGDFLEPLAMERHTPTDLRNVSNSPDMLIVTHEDFKSSADRLAQHRRSNYPYGGSPSIKVVTAEEVFDNFSGGLVDPTAIRNYCKFLYDNFTDDDGFPVLAFLFLFGDANIDYKNYTTSQQNFVTTYLNLHPHNLDAYATDDWFVEMELPDSTGATYIQLPVGRLPPGSVSEAQFLAQKLIDYETVSDFGPWRNRILLVADDEKSPSTSTQTIFTVQSESIAHGYMSPYLEPRKIYLTEYPAISGIKPQSRFDFLNEWNDGALIINYVGHGSSSQMA